MYILLAITLSMYNLKKKYKLLVIKLYLAIDNTDFTV